MNLALYIGLAGAAGSMSRYALGTWLSGVFVGKTVLPVGTLAVNILGSLLMGLVVALFVSRGDVDSRTRIVLTVGFLGGFTTYSSFALETVGLWEGKSATIAGAYVFLTLLGGGAACVAGLTIGRRF